MSFLIVVVALVAGLGYVYKKGWQEHVANAVYDLDHSTENLRNEAIELIKKGLRAFSDVIRRASMFLLAVGILVVAGIVVKGKVGIGPALLIMAMGTTCFIWVWRQRREPEDPPPATPGLAWWKQALHWLKNQATSPASSPTPLTTSILALFTFGFTTFVVSQWSGNQPLAVVGAAFDVAAAYMAYFILWPMARTLVAGIDLGELGAEWVIEFAQSLNAAFKAFKAPPKASGRPNIANQEEIMPGLERGLHALLAAFAASHVFGIHFPGFDTLFIVSGVIGLTVFFAWKLLQAQGVDIGDRTRRAAFVFEILAYAFIFYTLAKLALPSVLTGFEAWVKNAWHGGVRVTFFDWKMALGGFFVGMLGAVLVLKLWRPMTPAVPLANGGFAPGLSFMRWMRNAVAFGFIGFAVFNVIGLGCAARGLSTGRRADSVSARGLSLSEMSAPTAAVDNQKVRLTWPEAEGAVEYHLERRSVTDAVYRTVPGAGSLKRGVKTWVDDPGMGEFYYRLLAINANGSVSDPSPEVRVVLTPQPPVQKSDPPPVQEKKSATKSEPASAVAAAPVPTSACTDGPCDLMKADREMCKVVGIPCD